MHFRNIFSITLGMFLFLSLSCTSSTDDEAFKHELENNYIQFLKALKKGDDEGIKKAMSSYFYASTRNDCADAKELFTAKIKEMSEVYPEPSDMDFIKIFKKGPTSALLFSRDSDATEVFGRPMLMFLFIKFVKEGTTWKTDAIELMDVEKYNADGSVTAFEESFLSEGSLIDGKVREAP